VARTPKFMQSRVITVRRDENGERKQVMEARNANPHVHLVCNKFFLTPDEARALGLQLFERADEIDPDTAS